MKYRTIILLCTLVSIRCGRSASYYIDTYAVDPSIEVLLDAHAHTLARKIDKLHGKRLRHALGVWQFDWLPGYYVKYGVERIKGVDRLKRCIDNYNLTLLAVPDKRLYHIPGRSKALTNDNYVIVVPAIEKHPVHQPLSVEEVTQLCTLIKKTGYMDMTDTNYRRAPDGKIYLTDTEGFNKDRIIKGFLRMVGTEHDLNNDYTIPALKYLFSEIKHHLQNNPHLVRFTLSLLDEFIGWQDGPPAWDYRGYADTYFAEYYTNLADYAHFPKNPFTGK